MKGEDAHSGYGRLNRNANPQDHVRGVRIAQALVRRPLLVLGALTVVSFALGWPMLRWEPDATASQSPVNEVTRTQELAAERFADDIFRYLLVVEAKTGDILDKQPLLALLQNTESLRNDDAIAPYLIALEDPLLGIDALGAWTIADSVDRLLRQAGISDGLAGATESQVDETVGVMLQQAEPIDWGLAAQTTLSGGIWQSPAVFMEVATDNEELGGGGFLVTIGTDDLQKEEFARSLRNAAVGDGEQLSVWAPAADVNLTSNEQGELAGPFIGLTIAAVLLIVGYSFRSYWAVAISGAALAMLMIWLQGGANLIGLKSDQLLSIILPISMISFGIDSAFHGIGRVREEAGRGMGSRAAFATGLGSVLGALALAATSDSAAFLANTAAGIESIVQFGFAAALATIAAFMLLGVGTPLALALIEEQTAGRSLTRLGTAGDLAVAVLAAVLATATVMMLVFVSPAAGLFLLAGYLVVALALPFLVARRRPVTKPAGRAGGGGGRRLGRSVGAVASRPRATILVAGAVTAIAVLSAMRLDASFDVTDFFAPDSDFVVALDKTAEYLGDQGGEPALVYVETDLTDSEALASIRRFVADVSAATDSPLARSGTGEIQVEAGVLELLDDIEGSGSLTTEGELAEVYATALAEGVDGTKWTPNAVGTVLWSDGSGYATALTYAIPDTRDQANVIRARRLLEPAADALETRLREIDSGSSVVVTGSAVYRDSQLAAVRRALLLALPIAVFACLVAAAAFMRSIRYATVTIVPILLVVSWLYGVMYPAGYSINVVSAIIGAVSIGIGIDFSTHFTMRFLEETRRGASKWEAIEAAGAGTGSALFGSALTSVAGFGILAFAPMPMFATYGLLTALMIILALLASLFVLPSLLVVVTPGPRRRDQSTRSARIIDLRDDAIGPIRIGLARDLSDAVIARVFDVSEELFRSGNMVVRTLPAAAVPGLVGDGSLDLGLVVRWPEQPIGADDRVESLSLAREELMAVGGAARLSGERASIDTLARGLLVTGPHPETEQGVASLIGGQAHSPVLVHSVADVATGIRLVALTGGAMVLPSSMIDVGALPVRPLDPPAWVETVLLATPHRSADKEIFELILALIDAVSEDPALAVEAGLTGTGRSG